MLWSFLYKIFKFSGLLSSFIFKTCCLVSNYQKLSQMIKGWSSYVSTHNFLAKSLQNMLSIIAFEATVIQVGVSMVGYNNDAEIVPTKKSTASLFES